MFRLDHIGILVEKLEPVVELYCKMLNFPPDQVEYHFVPSEGLRIAMLNGNTKLEFLEPADPESGLGKALSKRGPGLHHLCFGEPAPLEEKLAALKAQGLQLLDEVPRVGAEGRIFFVHPKSAGGILTEFVEEG